MARPEKRQETETISVTIPVATFNALVHLASFTTFGFTENTAAAYIIAKEIERMQKASDSA